MSHYETLGIPRDASPEDVKRAFRSKASAAHPDREGGSAEAMAAVNEAHEVLMDPERRARYDETGDGAAPNSIEHEAQKVLLQLFSAALDGSDGDVLADASRMLAAHRSGLLDMRGKAEKQLARLVRRSGKVRNTGTNLVQMLIDEKTKALARNIADMGRGIEINDAAQLALSTYAAGAEPAMLASYDYARNYSPLGITLGDPRP